MIKKLILVCVFILMPLQAFAADFTATVDDTHVAAGEAFPLQLNLTDAEPKAAPDTTALQNEFDIAGQAQTSTTNIINGHVSSSIGWQLSLIPRQTGKVVIPAVTVATDSGTLATKPITMEVGGNGGGSAAQTAASARTVADVKLTASASATDPYQNQPVIYTVTVIAHANMSDIALDNVTAEGAIVQPEGKPEIRDMTDNGEAAKQIRFHFLITPVQARPITVAPVVMHANIQETAPIGRLRGGLPQGFIDPFQMMQDMDNFPGFARLRPIRIASNAVTLNVRPPATAMEPWLPLHALQIKDKLDLSQTAKVGEPITRKLTLLADGAVGSQLPSLEPQQNVPAIKVYADKPVTSETVDTDSGKVLGKREESYSLIPQSAGELRLPAIRLAWWNIDTGHMDYAEVPERTIQVSPSPTMPTTASTTPVYTAPAVTPPAVPPVAAPSPANSLGADRLAALPFFRLYIIIAVLLLIIVLAGSWVVRLQRKIARLQANPVSASGPDGPEVAAPPHVNGIDWDNIQTPAALNEALLAYAHQRWGTPRNAALETAFAPAKTGDTNSAELMVIMQELTAALYAGKTVDLGNLKSRCCTLLTTFNKPLPEKTNVGDRLGRLNPS